MGQMAGANPVTTGDPRGMEPTRCRDLMRGERVARLATCGPTGPHLVPIVFAVEGDRIFSAVDHKPKRTVRLKRISNILANPAVSLLADHYADDWERLWWVRADGLATISESGTVYERALDALADRYPQYRSRRPEGPVIEVAVQRWTGWRFSQR